MVDAEPQGRVVAPAQAGHVRPEINQRGGGASVPRARRDVERLLAALLGSNSVDVGAELAD